ncbi:DinB family protein [Bacillus sp. AFS041924]|uniref:DinB family protein n=1 Tax=Bacillus sp. AFS041924 TaxID=2033503 RepID=UPI000BFB19E7|nr:hypothetical protein COC46_21580 [Bacillus sp. AFS041924]
MRIQINFYGIFSIIKKNIQKLLNLLKKCPENKRTVVPEGFKNNIYWRIGHILYSTDYFVLGLSGYKKCCQRVIKYFFHKVQNHLNEVMSLLNGIY